MAKILIIDDDPMIVDLLRTRLTEAGHQIAVAMDAYGAGGAAAREKPDLITLDFQMPAGDGATAYSRLRGNTFTVATPIIFISGINPGEILSRLPKDPLVRVITKPIDMDELSKHIAELLGLPPPTGGPSKEAAPPKPRGFDGGSMGGDILDIKL